MSEQDATTTFLICFSGHDAASSRVGVNICLGQRSGDPVTKAKAADERPFFFEVMLSNVAVQVASPLPGGPPVQGIVNIRESLLLSVQDVVNLQRWLDKCAPPPGK